MTEDYSDILDQNVDEVKKAVRELEAPDYSELLELEKDGKDRKTIRDFLSERIEEAQEEAEEQAEDVVEEIEEETAGGFLGDFSREKVLAGGAVSGVVIGLLVGLAFAGQSSASASAADVENSLQQFYELSGNSPDAISVSQRSGMYYAQINMSQETENGTQTSSQNFYVSPNGELLFPEISSPLMTNPYNLNDLIARAQAQQRQPNATGNATQ